MEVADGLRVGSRDRGLGVDLGLVQDGAAEEAGPVVGVVLEDLERQADRVPSVTQEVEEQPVLRVELGAVVRMRRELLDVRRAEIVALDGRAHLVEGCAVGAGIETVQSDESHDTSRTYQGGLTKKRADTP